MDAEVVQGNKSHYILTIHYIAYTLQAYLHMFTHMCMYSVVFCHNNMYDMFNFTFDLTQ